MHCSGPGTEKFTWPLRGKLRNPGLESRHPGLPPPMHGLSMLPLRPPLGELLLVLIQIHIGHLLPPYCLEENSNGH
jgi:hypothetical protein